MPLQSYEMVIEESKREAGAFEFRGEGMVTSLFCEELRRLVPTKPSVHRLAYEGYPSRNCSSGRHTVGFGLWGRYAAAPWADQARRDLHRMDCQALGRQVRFFVLPRAAAYVAPDYRIRQFLKGLGEAAAQGRDNPVHPVLP